MVIGGGYIGMEVAAAATGWNLDTTVSQLVVHASIKLIAYQENP